MPTPETHEPPRLRLANTWLDEWDPDVAALAATAPGGEVARPPRRAAGHCHHCGGDLTRSLMSRYERALTVFTTRRPYRCTDCKRRRWREPSRFAVLL